MSNPTVPVEITDRIRSGVADFIEGEIRRGIERNFDAIIDPAGFLADSDPAPATLSFAKGITRQVCRAWARGDTPIQGIAADAIYGPLCTPYLETIDENPLSPGEVAFPFEGGQCEGTTYALRGSFTLRQVVCSSGFEFPPITRTIEEQFGNITRIGPITVTRPWESESQCRGAPRQVGVSIANAGGPVQNIVWFGQANDRGHPGWSVSGLRWEPLGGPDDCGNPPSLYLPPQTRPGLPPLEPFVPTDGPLGGTPIGISFNPDGSINVTAPDLGLDVTVPNPLAGGGGEDTIAPGDQGTAGEEGAETATSDEGEDTDRNLVGILVRLRNIPSRANALFNNHGAVYKGACFVYFGGEGGFSLVPEAQFCKTEQFFYAPKGANKWRVIPNIGYSLSVQPFFED